MAVSRWDPFQELSSIQPDGIQASFDAGVLMIEVPKKEEAKPRKIQVKATG